MYSTQKENIVKQVQLKTNFDKNYNSTIHFNDWIACCSITPPYYVCFACNYVLPFIHVSGFQTKKITHISPVSFFGQNTLFKLRQQADYTLGLHGERIKTA
jgi:hypothetical protein